MQASLQRIQALSTQDDYPRARILLELTQLNYPGKHIALLWLELAKKALATGCLTTAEFAIRELEAGFTDAPEAAQIPALRSQLISARSRIDAEGTVALIASFQITTDRFEDVTWYRPMSAAHYWKAPEYSSHFGPGCTSRGRAFHHDVSPWEPWDYSHRLVFCFYFGEKDGVVTPRLLLNTTTGAWTFWTDLVFLIDGQRYTLAVLPREKETEVLSGGLVAEWMDVPVGPDELRIISALGRARWAEVRLQGSSDTHDIRFTEEHLVSIAESLAAYEATRAAKQIC